MHYAYMKGSCGNSADTTSCTGMGAGVNVNNQWDWEGNGNETRLNLGLGMGMGINHWEWEGMGLKKIFPLISTLHAAINRHKMIYILKYTINFLFLSPVGHFRLPRPVTSTSYSFLTRQRNRVKKFSVVSYSSASATI